MLVTQDRERRGAQVEQPAVRGRQPQPAGRQHAEKMAVAEEQLPPFDRPQPGDDPIGPGADLLDRLAARAAVAKQRPARASCGGSPPSSARRIRRNPIPSGPARSTACPPKPASSQVRRARASGLIRTSLKSMSTQPLAQAAGIRFAALGQRDVGPAGVLVRERPGRLAVPGQIDCGKLVGHFRESRGMPGDWSVDLGLGRSAQVFGTAAVRSLRAPWFPLSMARKEMPASRGVSIP